jgi:hypothetical protein
MFDFLGESFMACFEDDKLRDGLRVDTRSEKMLFHQLCFQTEERTKRFFDGLERILPVFLSAFS